MKDKALILFSGGQDSTTCLFWAKQHFNQVEAVFLHYEQRHHLEYDSAKYTCEKEHVELHELTLPAFKEIGGTAMIDEIQIEMNNNGLPNTFVPGRNIVFLTLAASLAYRRGIHHIVIGVNEEDFSGYPDCREDFIRSIETSLNLGLDYSIEIHTPLQHLDKAGIWKLADELQILEHIIKHSHTCYKGEHQKLNDWGYGCGSCPACILRKSGYSAFLKLN